MAIAGKPLFDNQLSKASAPLFVSTNTRVKACCDAGNRQLNQLSKKPIDKRA